MIFTARLAAAAALALAALVLPLSTAWAEPLLPITSQTNVHRIDPVDAAKGSPNIGSPEFAYRDGETVHYFSSIENCGEYVADAKKFPDADKAVKLAFFGADIVLRFPNGVRSSDLGPVTAGDPKRFMVTYEGATFAFQNKVTMATFRRDPGRYMPPVGGYCLGAMSADRVTPGDPRNVYYVAEVGQWAVFGSPNGPAAWARMTPDERRAKYAAAVANYLRKTGLAPALGKVASLH